MSYSFSRTKLIEKIVFGLLSPNEIRKMSAARIITADTYDEDGLPIPSGLMDQRLGTIEPGQRCQTCGNLVSNCMGHFGHIELARPVIHVGYAKKVLKMLRSICPECSRLMLTEEEMEGFREEQVKHRKVYSEADAEATKIVFKLARKSKICPYCGAKKKKIVIEKPTTYYEEEENKGSHRITPIEVLERLKKMSDNDLRILGITPEKARLEWVIFTVLPIPPVCARPSITLDSGIRSKDDLTIKLIDVIRINQRLRENIDAGAPHLIVEDLWELLQYHITTYLDNQLLGIPPARHRSGRALRTLTQRLKGKEGRFRSNLSGKRVDFSARSVISPSPYISINEVGVPLAIAKILTIPTNVNDWNIEEMKQMVLNGPFKHPGANFIIRTDRRRVDLRYVKNREIIAEMLAPGFTVERHLSNGDIVLLNRQPSLHRISIMAHRVKVMNGKTFRLNPFVCSPYNADFDGDEMNLHVPQSEEARAEAEILLMVHRNMLSPKNGELLIGGIQDFISCIFKFTGESFFNKKETLQMLYSCNFLDDNLSFDFNKLKIPDKISGKKIFSLIFPPNFNYNLRTNLCQKCNQCQKNKCYHKAYISIKNGILLCGSLDEKAFGVFQSNNIIKNILCEYGNHSALRFIENSIKILLFFMSKIGITLGLDDFLIEKKGDLKIQKIIKNANLNIDNLIEKFYTDNHKIGNNKALIQKSWKNSMELDVKNILKKTRDEIIKIAYDHIKKGSNLELMVKSGSRKNRIKLTQLVGIMAQQIIYKKRIFKGYNYRTLPHFKINDFKPRSRGFVESSLFKGLKPDEFFYHSIAGRNSIIDKEIRTSTSGYFQRRLINALMDLYVEYDGSVRTYHGRIIQFEYGDDRCNPQMSVNSEIIDLEDLINKAKSL